MPPLTLSGTDGIDVGTTNVIDENGNILINGNVLSDGNSIRVPSGTTGERPASPATGELRFNTDTSSLEQYNGTNWVSVVPDDIDLNSISINSTQIVDSSGNINTSGDVTANSFVGDGSQLNNLPPSGGTYTAIASGSLSSGDLVIVNSDETVSVVDNTVTTNDPPDLLNSVGGVQVTVNSVREIVGTFDSNNNAVVIAFRDTDNNNTTTAIAGSVNSDGSITFGNKVVLDSNNGILNPDAITFDSNENKIVITYDEGGNVYGIVGEVINGNELNFGARTPIQFTGKDGACVFDSFNNKVVFSYSSNITAEDGFGYSRVGTISGTSITNLGNEVLFYNNQEDVSTVFDSNENKIVNSFFDKSGAGGFSVVGEVSGDSISFGSAVNFDSNAGGITSTFDSDENKVVIVYEGSSNNNAVVGDVSGTSISFGTPVSWDPNKGEPFECTYDSTAKRVVITFRKFANNTFDGLVVLGQVSGNSISFGTEIQSMSKEIERSIPIDIPNTTNTQLFFEADTAGGRYLWRNTIETASITSNLTTENYIGVSDGSYSDGNTATINVVGSVANVQSGLTPGKTVFVKVDNTLSETPDLIAEVVAGTTVSSNKIIVKG